MRVVPLSSSLMVGTTFGTSPHASAAAVSSPSAGPLGRAMAITRTVAPVWAATSRIRDRSPSTGTPWIRSRRLAGSSSRNATGW